MDQPRSAASQRLRDLTRVAYTAAAGHLEVDPEEGEERAVRAWPVRRAVVAVLVVLAVVVGLLAARYLIARPGPGEEIVPGGEGTLAAATQPDGAAAPPDAGQAAGEDVEQADGGTGSAADGGGSSEESPAAHGSAPDAQPGDENPSGGPAAGDSDSVVVHVAGAVSRPGLVALAPGARVGDAVDASGGAAPEADLAQVNLARPLVDGEQVYVPVVGEEPREPPDGPAAGSTGAAPGTDGGDGADATGASGESPGLVDLNTAGAGELETLPGIGPAIAGRIVAHREEVGGFTSVDELDDVSGIGPVLMEQLRDLVTV